VDCAKPAQIKVIFSTNQAAKWKGDEESEGEGEEISTVRAAEWEEGEPPALSGDELLICDNVIPGFSLSAKRWCFFELDYIQEFEYNTRAFESLVLAEEQKSMTHSLVKIHADERPQFDDHIQGKGKGMIFLLHGEPGVGKTLTAGKYLLLWKNMSFCQLLPREYS